MITRMAYSDLRITLDWDFTLAYSKTGTTLEDLVTSTGAFHSAPAPTMIGLSTITFATCSLVESGAWL